MYVGVWSHNQNPNKRVFLQFMKRCWEISAQTRCLAQISRFLDLFFASRFLSGPRASQLGSLIAFIYGDFYWLVAFFGAQVVAEGDKT